MEMVIILHIVFFLALSLSPSFAEEVSKACYGPFGIPCTTHRLRCSSGHIAIKEAFFMESTACDVVGVVKCVNITDIQLTGERYKFSDMELNSLYQNCSSQSTCSLQADRRGVTFSAIIYECINESTLRPTSTKASMRTPTHGTTRIHTSHTRTSSGSFSVGPTDRTTEIGTDEESINGTVVGIIVPLCIIIAGGVTAVIIFRRRKKQQKGETGNVAKSKSNPQEVHSLQNKSSTDYGYATTNKYFDLLPKAHNMPTPPKGSSGYDYAKGRDQKASHNLSSRNTQTRDSDYDHIGRQPARANGHYDTTLSVADANKGGNSKQEVYSYNHLNEKVSSNADVDSTYNMTASTRQKLDASSNDMEDDYGYNHLGTESKKNLPQSEYDTTASAIRDLARMTGYMEDSTYDHANLKTSDFSSSRVANAAFQESDYDHASPTTAVHKDEYGSNALQHVNHKVEGKTDVYMLAQEVDSNPYQLAK